MHVIDHAFSFTCIFKKKTKKNWRINIFVDERGILNGGKLGQMKNSNNFIELNFSKKKYRGKIIRDIFTAHLIDIFILSKRSEASHTSLRVL